MRFRTQYDDDYRAEIFETDVGEDEGLVQQDMRDQCDVNFIMRQYQSSGVLTHVSSIAGEYGDFSEVMDYHSGLEQLRAADELFMELPSSVRDRFKNDPGAFLEFALDPSNLDAMREMGLAPPKHDASASSEGGARTPSSEKAKPSTSEDKKEPAKGS